VGKTVTASWGQKTEGHAVLVHGGAGARDADELEPSRSGCAKAAALAGAILRAGGRALDAVQAAVEALEDDPCFNAGTGGALSEAGTLLLDASIMEGRDLRAGAVCALPPHRHPIAIARAVLEDGRHVLYAGDGAVTFARSAGFVPVDPESMITAKARALLERWLRAREQAREGNTVGAVARDRHGHVAAATSTGGITGKRPGRVGDSPIIGAGTYADDLSGAASATGAGEGILRVALCTRVVDAMSLERSAEQAAREALANLADRIGTDAGVIVIGRDGSLGWARTTSTMAWAAEWDGGDAAGC
jgi:beta-aspartyl-peptidase (threonine type)